MKSIKTIALFMSLLVLTLPVCFASEINVQYDENGNMVYDGKTKREYNSLNQLWKVYNGSDNTTLLQEYTYDPEEERVIIKHDYIKNETVYYFSKDYVRIINSTGTYDYEYIYHNGQMIAQINPNGDKVFVNGDHLGSSSVITNESGDVIERTDYAPSGEIVSGGTETRFNYENKEYDSVLGDTDFHFRQYKQDWNLFTQPDTLIPNVYDPQSLNRYMFERGNPYKYTDETGHEAQTDNFLQRIFAAYVWGKIQRWHNLETNLRNKYDNSNKVPEACYGCEPKSPPTFRELQRRELDENFDIILDEDDKIAGYLYNGKVLKPNYKEMTDLGFYKREVKKAVESKYKEKTFKPDFNPNDVGHAGERGSNYAKITRRTGEIEYVKIK